MQTKAFTKIVFLLLALCIAGCSTLSLEKPGISLIAFTPMPSSGLDIQFGLDLKITNPNAIALPLAGMSYQIALNDYAVLKGVSGELPTIAPYSENVIHVTVSSSLLSAPKFILGLINKPQQDIRFQFKSKIDLKGALPSFNITEEGILPLQLKHHGSQL